MTACVPSLTGSLLLRDPQSIVAYTLRRYFRQPADTISILSDLIISLPWRVAQCGKDPEALCSAIQTDLQGCLSRIFGNDRRVTVSTSFTRDQTDEYNVTISVMFTALNGELEQTGTTISLDKNGRLVIPEDNLDYSFVRQSN